MLLVVGGLSLACSLACSSGTGKQTNTSAGAGGSSPAVGGTVVPASSSGGATGIGGASASGGTGGSAGDMSGLGGMTASGGATTGSGGAGGTVGSGGMSSKGGTTGTGGVPSTGGTGGSAGSGGVNGLGGTQSSSGATGTAGSGPIGVITGDLAAGIAFKDTDGVLVNAHGGGIIQVGDTFYLHGEYFLPSSTTNDFNGFSMYSSKDLVTWKNEGIILPQQPSGDLGPIRKGERPHIIKCPATGEFVLYAHAASEDYQTDKEVIYATSATVNGKYAFQGRLTNASGVIAAHSDMGVFVDGADAYVVTESGHIYKLSTDCHSWLSDDSYSAMNGMESPTVFKANGTYYWIMSNKTGWRANNNEYATATSMTGPWTKQGYVAPVTDSTNDLSDQRTWLTQSTWVQPIVGSKGTVFLYWGDHWYGCEDTTGATSGKHNDQATYVFQPIVFSNADKTMLPAYLTTWKIDIGAGTWSQ